MSAPNDTLLLKFDMELEERFNAPFYSELMELSDGTNFVIIHATTKPAERIYVTIQEKWNTRFDVPFLILGDILDCNLIRQESKERLTQKVANYLNTACVWRKVEHGCVDVLVVSDDQGVQDKAERYYGLYEDVVWNYNWADDGSHAMLITPMVISSEAKDRYYQNEFKNAKFPITEHGA